VRSLKLQTHSEQILLLLRTNSAAIINSIHTLKPLFSKQRLGFVTTVLIRIKRLVNVAHFLTCGLLWTQNKHCSKILQETLLNSVSNDLLPFMVGQSHDNFTQPGVKDVRFFRHC
jgi:hypothetical protein